MNFKSDAILHVIERFHMTSPRPYWCIKPILRELKYWYFYANIFFFFCKPICFEVECQLHKIAPTSCSRFHIKIVYSIICVRILFIHSH